MKNKYAQKIVPFLWFDNNAEAAVKYYLSIFRNSRIVEILRCGEAGPGPQDSVLTIAFELEGQRFIALNGGPEHKFSRRIRRTNWE
jgi:predicted 3-demethylubiquinone-9 3-methyltransferase (glyoxalase superfamily)